MKIITFNEFQARADKMKDPIVKSLARVIDKHLRNLETDFYVWNHAMWPLSPLRGLHKLSKDEQDKIFMQIWKEGLEPGGWKEIGWNVDEDCIRIKITKP